MNYFIKIGIIGIIVLCPATTLIGQINNGLIAHFNFNNNALDISGQNNHGVVGGATLTTDIFGNPNSAYLFDGFNDNIEIPTYVNMSPTQGVTISAWIKTTSSSGSPIIYERLETNMGFALRLNDDGQLRLSINGGVADAVSQEVLITDKWYHVIGTYDAISGELKLYIYGDLVATNLYNQAIDYSLEPRNSIGAYGSSYPGAYFNGSIDELRVYDKALDAYEVDVLFSSETSQQPVLGLDDENDENDIVNSHFNLLGQHNFNAKFNLFTYSKGGGL